MRPLYTKTDFDLAKGKDLLPLYCKHCGNRFFVSKNEIKISIRMNYEKHKFCSQNCFRLFKNKSKTSIVFCAQCNKQLKRLVCQNKQSKSGNHFCSQSCSATYNNEHKKHGTRRSKLEKWIEQKLTEKYPSLEIHYNRKDAICSELDFYFPSLKLAFELNGIYHYEAIHGKQKLEKIKNNDERKLQACIENDIEFCIIDVSSFSYFKENKAAKFLEIITKIVDNKIGANEET